MKKYSLYIIVIPLAIAIFGLFIWLSERNIQNETISSKNTIRFEEDISYKFATDINNQNAKGGKVEWLGVISDRSHISGIKFWILDEKHPVATWNYYDWFWAIPNWKDAVGMHQEDYDDGVDFDGNYVAYMMDRYGGFKNYSYDPDGIYRISGIFDGKDCDLYGDVDMHKVCIPSVIVEKIDLVGSLPSFEKYPVDRIFTGLSAPLDLESHPVGLKYKTVLRGAYTGTPNFAGHYTIATYGCGSPCQRFVIIDNQTGKLYQTEEFQSAVGIDFQKESNLLIINSPSTLSSYRDDNEKDGRAMATWEQFPSYYYKWENNELILVYPEQKDGSDTSSQAKTILLSQQEVLEIPLTTPLTLFAMEMSWQKCHLQKRKVIRK